MAGATLFAFLRGSWRLIPPPEPIAPKSSYRAQPEVVTMPARPIAEEVPLQPADTLRYASRRWHAEAWERERERELRAVEKQSEIASRRRANA